MPQNKVSIILTKSLTLAQKENVLELWNSEYPAHLRYNDLEGLEEYLQRLIDPCYFIVQDDDLNIKAWLVTFTRDDACWFAMIVNSSLKGQGIGSRLLNAAKDTKSELNGWATDHNRDIKADGTPYPSPIEFYLKNGFEVSKDIRFEKGKLSTVKIQWKT